ncbi:MAG: ATP-binding cassette domain-containing protein [Methylotenera sp.]|nr:ATP-binding cassette domain-containing protein [Oligoflexia bacterium]
MNNQNSSTPGSTLPKGILEIRNLKKHFEVSKGSFLHAVDGITLSIGKNEVVGLVGESGCGKSTLGRTLVGLYDKSSGEVVYQGEKLPSRYASSDFKKYSREIQMIFQDPYSSLNPRMTVREIIAEGPMIHKLWKSDEVNEKVGFWLKRVGLSADHMSRYAHEFSGGQRQRIGIARALALEPKVIICDEPISALDVSVQAQVVNLLGELKRTMGLTLLFIAHDLSMVRYVSDRMAVMYLGSMVEVGPANEVYFRPLHPYTQSLIASNPEPDPEKERSRTHTVLKGEIPSPINLKPGCRFAGRCPKAMTVCQSVDPVFREVKPGHSTACHLYA